MDAAEPFVTPYVTTDAKGNTRIAPIGTAVTSGSHREWVVATVRSHPSAGDPPVRVEAEAVARWVGPIRLEPVSFRRRSKLVLVAASHTSDRVLILCHECGRPSYRARLANEEHPTVILGWELTLKPQQAVFMDMARRCARVYRRESGGLTYGLETSIPLVLVDVEPSPHCDLGAQDVLDLRPISPVHPCADTGSYTD
jgi:hypothetical protein